MKKDKAWLIQKVSDIFWRVEIDGNFNIQNANIMFDDISNLIDQLDEPENLSQEWIDENKVERINNLRKMTTSDVVTVEKLKNLLVPKQDTPVISQYEVSVHGCDDSTTIIQELTFEECEFLKKIAEKITNASDDICMPIMEIEEVTKCN